MASAQQMRKLRGLISQLAVYVRPDNELTEPERSLRQQLNYKFAEILQKKGA